MSDPRLDLAARLEAAEGADRSLDVEMALLLGFTRRDRMADCPGHEPLWEYTDHTRSMAGAENVIVRAYTSSLEAILAVIAEKLPGWKWGRDFAGFAGLRPPQDARFKQIGAHGATPALALAAAFLRALAASAPLTAKEEG